MKRVRFTEEQIITVLREHEAGAKTADLARKHGISEATLYNWKAKYGGMDVSEARRLRTLEDENRKLKKLLAESMLDPRSKSFWQKNGRARCEARCCRSFAWRAGDERAAGLQPRCRRSQDDPLSVTSSRQTRSCVSVCASLPINGAGSAIGGSSSCCELTASHPASTASTGSIARRDWLCANAELAAR